MYDSAVFQLIGKNWAEGRVPYKDLWELKGPLVFLPSALGYWFCGSKIGVYVIQMLNMTVAFYFVQKIYSLEFSRKTSILLTGLATFYFIVLYESGNTVEEYLIPLLTCAFYFLYRYVDKCIETKEYDLPSSYALTFGCVLGFSLMSRITNAISICAAISVIGIMLIIHRRWFNLMKSFLFLISGFIALTIPFFIYFWSKDALQEMWYGTFLFGLEYAGNSGFDIFSLFGLRHIVLRMANCYLLVLVAILILRFNPQRKFAGLMWLAVSILTTLVFLRLNPFGHYYIITLPFIPIIINEIHKIWMVNSLKWSCTLLRLVISLYIILGIIGIANNLKNYFLVFHDYKELAVYEKIVNRLPSDFRSSFIAYDCDTELYLYFNISPQYPFFAGQSLLISYGPSIKSKIEKCFYDSDAKYMVVYGKPKLLQDVINRKYSFLFSEKNTRDGMYNIYCLK